MPISRAGGDSLSSSSSYSPSSRSTRFTSFYQTTQSHEHHDQFVIMLKFNNVFYMCSFYRCT